MSTSSKIIAAAIVAEIILIGTGLALAATMGLQAFSDHGNLMLAVSAAGFPLILAVLEVFKIPSGIALYKSNWLIKPLALLALLGGMVATAETVTMAGSTWFRSIQYEVAVSQADLDALIRTRDNTGEAENSLVAARQAAVKQIRSQLAEVSIEDRRTEARGRFAGEWDQQSLDNERRAQSENTVIRREAERSQASLPSRTKYIAARMAEWEAEGGVLLVGQVGAADRLRDQLIAANSALADAQTDVREAMVVTVDLDNQIEQQRLLVAQLASSSVIYDIASKVWGKPAYTVSEAEANEVTKWVIGGVAVAASLATGLAALLATHMASAPPKLSLGQALRLYAVSRRWRRKQTIEKIIYTDRVVYKTLPHPESIKTFDRSVWADLLNKKEEKDAA